MASTPVDRPPVDVQAQLLDAISDLGVAVLVAKGQRFVYANAAAARLAGIDVAELTSGASFFDMVAPEERARLQERLKQRLAGSLAEHVEMEVTLKNGRRAVLEMAVKMLPEEPGAFVVLYRDVTARKEEEARLRKAEKMAAVGRLLVGVAHDVNTPLAVVLSNVEVSREQLAHAAERGLTPEETRTLLARAETNQAHLRRIAASIRRLQGLGAPQALRRARTDVAETVLAAVEAVRASAPPGLRVEARVDALPRLPCDRELVAHAVQNLVANGVEAARSRVDVRASVVDGAIEVVVEDDGPGFAPDAIERSFEPFVTTKPAGNMGLGLTLARAVAQDHGGTLVATNRAEGGARLTMRLPLVPP